MISYLSIANAVSPPFQPELRAVAKKYTEFVTEWNPLYVKGSALFYQFEVKENCLITLVPDACCNILFTCQSDYARADFQGVFLKSYEIELQKDITYFGCKPYSILGLKPGGVSISNLLNMNVNFLDLYPHATQLIKEMAEDISFEQRIQTINRFKEEVMLSQDDSLFLVDEVSVLLCIENGEDLQHFPQMDYIEKQVGYSKRHFRQKFAEIFGFPPSYYGRIIRFQNTLKDIFFHKDLHYVEIATNNGYFDQSHLIREFKSFTDFSPQQFVDVTESLFLIN
ncbi:AraC family transcriptional regulator [Vagococcus sp. DIV0080]|uniref:AraC family transcriptional regulator n=1 Tax=Candidatus Vagococcus giribetii TaxID=2230876 RepID=A0ABS3HUP9_9ENTE|nr:AraC family transcriptional regulator [Vagococcus sp. DIV0080]MBO0477420.1 AraC family transcriptional regulator [Vagococcus sp. DIV0080]